MSVRAFDLVPALSRDKLLPDRAKTEIVCIESCGKNLYVGTDDCCVMHFVVEEKISSGGKVYYESKKQGQKHIGMKKPIVQMKAASALNRILILCDGTILLLNMLDLEPVTSGAKIKGITCFCLNENPMKSNPFAVEICVALRKKNLQVLTVCEDKISQVKDIPTIEPPVTMSMDGSFVCAALSDQYKIYDYSTAMSQELFPFDPDQLKPIITQISREEFLLNAPSALGMFANTTGISQRPPLQWSNNLISVAHFHPYVLALSDEFVTVHSIIDQHQKQSIPFQGGILMGEYDGKLYIASNKDVYSLVPVPIEKQIQQLLGDKRVTEALDLAKNVRKIGLSKEKFKQVFKRIQQQAAFIHFAEGNLEEARNLFLQGNVDVREVITLFPHLLPASTDFVKTIPPLHEIADINQLAKGDSATIRGFKNFLISYLEEIRGTETTVHCQKEVDTALLKLYAEVNSPELITLIASDMACDVSDCASALEKYNRHHAMALLYRYHGDDDKALDVWMQIADDKIQDSLFPGIEFIVEFLANCLDYELVLKHSHWILNKDEELGVKIFTDRPTNEPISEKMKPDVVLDMLAKKYPKAVIKYLEYIVFTLKLEKEKYHTHLAVLYLDKVLTMMKSPTQPQESVSKARADFRHLLQNSSLYRVQMILAKLKDTDMYSECAILHGKLEEHDKALRILVLKLKDYDAAEKYCIDNAKGKAPEYRRNLFQALLAVYFDPSNERKVTLVAPAINLLNKNRREFDPLKVLQLIPENWSINLLGNFLTSSIRHSVNVARTKRLERNLARGENLQVKEEVMKVQKECIQVKEERLCAVCNSNFTEPTFVRYPNRIVAHVHCARNKNVCPVTGKLFSTSKPISSSSKSNSSSQSRTSPNKEHKVINNYKGQLPSR